MQTDSTSITSADRVRAVAALRNHARALDEDGLARFAYTDSLRRVAQALKAEVPGGRAVRGGTRGAADREGIVNNACIHCGTNLGKEAFEMPIGTRIADRGLLCPDCVDHCLAAFPVMLDALRAVYKHFGVLENNIMFNEDARAASRLARAAIEFVQRDGAPE